MHTCIIRAPIFKGKIVGKPQFSCICAPVLRNPVQSCLLMNTALLGDKVVTMHVLAHHKRNTDGACNQRT